MIKLLSSVILIILSIQVVHSDISICGYVINAFTSAPITSAEVTFSDGVGSAYQVRTDDNGFYNFTTMRNVSVWSTTSRATGYYTLPQNIIGRSSTKFLEIDPSFYESAFFMIPIPASSIPKNSYYFVFSWPWFNDYWDSSDLDAFGLLPTYDWLYNAQTDSPYAYYNYGGMRIGRCRDSYGMANPDYPFSPDLGPEVFSIINITGTADGRILPVFNSFPYNGALNDMSNLPETQRPKIQLYSVEAGSLITTYILPSNYNDDAWTPAWFDVMNGKVNFVENDIQGSSTTSIRIDFADAKETFPGNATFTTSGLAKITRTMDGTNYIDLFSGINLPMNIQVDGYVPISRNGTVNMRPNQGFVNQLEGNFRLVPLSAFDNDKTHIYVLTWDLSNANQNQNEFPVTVITSSCILQDNETECAGITYYLYQNTNYISYIRLENVSVDYVMFIGSKKTDWNNNYGPNSAGGIMRPRLEAYRKQKLEISISATNGTGSWAAASYCAATSTLTFGNEFASSQYIPNCATLTTSESSSSVPPSTSSSTSSATPTSSAVSTSSPTSTTSTSISTSSTAESPPSSLTTDKGGKSNSIIAIGAAAGGAALLIIIIIIIIVVVVKKKKKNKDNHASNIEMQTSKPAETIYSSPDPLRATTQFPGKSSMRQSSEYEAMPSPLQAKQMARGSIMNEDGRKTMGADFSGFVLRESDITYVKLIGQGAFGKVFLGEYKKTPVAIKQLNAEAADAFSIEEFKKEAKLMRDVPPHPNVVMFRGVTIPPDTMCIVTDFCRDGSLLAYLQGQFSSIAWSEKLQFMRDISRGMYHLHTCIPGKEIIHRDLAVRNILLQRGTALVGDFGMARTKNSSDESGRTTNNLGPLKWMAPESLFERVFSVKTDVFSFGVTMFEIISGDVPWKGIEAVAVVHLIGQGKRMTLPPSSGCPPSIQHLMEQCWQDDPDKRPDFGQICDQLDAIRL